MLRKEDTDWVKKCMEYEVEGPRPRGRPKRTWIEVVRKDCQACNLNREDAMDSQGCSLKTLVLVSRCLEDMENGLGLGLDEKSRYFQDLDE